MAVSKKAGTRKRTAVRTNARVRAGTGHQAELPRSLKEFSRKVGRDLTLLEKQIEAASRDAVCHCTRVLRNASYLLGRLEAAGEAEWRRSNQARLEALRAVRAIEGAIQPRNGKGRARKSSRPKSGGAAGHRRARPVTRGRGGTKG
jgi:hypothetical protein